MSNLLKCQYHVSLLWWANLKKFNSLTPRPLYHSSCFIFLSDTHYHFTSHILYLFIASLKTRIMLHKDRNLSFKLLHSLEEQLNCQRHSFVEFYWNQKLISNKQSMRKWERMVYNVGRDPVNYGEWLWHTGDWWSVVTNLKRCDPLQTITSILKNVKFLLLEAVYIHNETLESKWAISKTVSSRHY